MSTTPKNDKNLSDCDATLLATPQTPTSTVSQSPFSSGGSNTLGVSGHKGSLRGTKLARRAKSFKDDFLEKISQMRTTTSTMPRTHSPHSPKVRAPLRANPSTDDHSKPVQDLNYHVRQVKHALTHFKDVISKNKLEMLHGNGTVVLEAITCVHTALKSYKLNEHSSTIISATQQVHLALGKLIRLCDDVLLSDNEESCASLNKENVKEVVDLVENAIQNLVELANEKINENGLAKGVLVKNHIESSNTLQRPMMDAAGQRTSLPDIPLTPRERDILEQTAIIKQVHRGSHSQESVLRDSPSPPPKPPLPIRNSDPPPLPPKRRSSYKPTLGTNSFHDNSATSLLSAEDCNNFLNSENRLSSRSRSPEDNSDLLSCSGSIDSALNDSREEAELVDIMDDKKILNTSADEHDNCGPLSEQLNNRNSNESGIMSINSRSSVQSMQLRSQLQCSTFKSNTNHIISSNTSHQTTNTFSSNQILASSKNHISEVSKSLITNQISRQQTKQLFVATEIKELRDCESDNEDVFSSDLLENGVSETPKAPPLPVKTRPKSFKSERHKSQYDNVEEMENDRNSIDFVLRASTTASSSSSSLTSSSTVTGSNNALHPQKFHFQHQEHMALKNKYISCIEPRHLNHFTEVTLDVNSEQPPPLPIKKKHIMAYMEIFGNCAQNSNTNQEFVRHSMHTYSQTSDGRTSNVTASQNISHSHTMSLSPVMNSFDSPPASPNNSNNNLEDGLKPPALPPKRPRVNSTKSLLSTPPASPKIIVDSNNHNDIICPPPVSPRTLHSPNLHSPNSPRSPHSPKGNYAIHEPKVAPASPSSSRQSATAKTNKQLSNNLNTTDLLNNNAPLVKPSGHQNTLNNLNMNNLNNLSSLNNTHSINLKSSSGDIHNIEEAEEDNDEVEVVLRRNINNSPREKNSPLPAALNLMEEIEIKSYLVLKKEGEDGPDVKGGHHEALIIHATKMQKSSEAFGEAFITTFRTFITPFALIEKLTQRYSFFKCQIQDHKQRAARESFSLLVRVVNDLTAPDLTSALLQKLFEFNYQLVCAGELLMAKLLRVKLLEKAHLFKQKHAPQEILTSRAVIMNPPSLLDLKSTEIAEQMTLLDAQLFQKIEIPEVLIWAQEQCEERSPNLTRFTEHFNKMSYWARTQILKQQDAKDREKHVIKFIKIMKHLRKINNYNSYLALLSALDSAPIRRLEWHKTITEGLKEYCALIDSSSSFRAYRQALAETSPPCIPYIGLVLQDLTFVHIGNPDYLQDGSINFSKRWQQYNIVVNMKRFRKGSYGFKKSEKIIGFFDNFENYFDEDAMWHISESIKPRGARKVQNN